MSYTGQLGASDSSLGNIVLGAVSLSGVSIGEVITFTEILNVNLKGVQLSESVTFTEDLETYIPQIRVFPSESIVFNELLETQLIPNRSITEAQGFEEILSMSRAFTRNFSETIVFTEDLVGTRFIFDLDETIVFNETLNVVKVHNRALSESLIFTETLGRSATLNRVFSETINFVGGFSRRYGNGTLQIDYPELLMIKKENLFVIKGFNQAITLPNPEFDDSEATGDILTVYRSMTGQIYTYVNTQPLRKLNYTFQLDRVKAIELRKFFDQEKSNKLTVQNHKTELWVGYLTTNPINYTTVKRTSPMFEGVEVTLDFEAIRII